MFLRSKARVQGFSVSDLETEGSGSGFRGLGFRFSGPLNLGREVQDIVLKMRKLRAPSENCGFRA